MSVLDEVAPPVFDPVPAMVRPMARTVGPSPVERCVAVYVRTVQGTEHQVAVRPQTLEAATLEGAAQALDDRLQAGRTLRLELLDGTTLSVPADVIEEIEVRNCGQRDQ